MLKNDLQLFFLGVMAVLSALMVQVFVVTLLGITTGTPQSFSYYDTDYVSLFLITAALSEELLRALFIKRSLTLGQISSPFVGGVIFGFGFASVEFFSALFTHRLESISPFVIFMTIGLHILFSVIFYHIISQYKSILLFTGLVLVATLLHALYNSALYILTF